MKLTIAQMNKVVLLITLTCLVGGFVVSGVSCQEVRRSVSGVMPHHEESFTISKMYDVGCAVELSAGDSLEGSVQEITGDYNAFVFWVADPNGQTIYDVELSGKQDFVFKATIDGYYSLHFYTLSDDKHVIVKYRRT